MYVILNLPYWNSASCWRCTCLHDDRRSYWQTEAVVCF